MQVYFRVATYTEEMACRDEFSREILAQAERLGVELAFPTQTIHLAPADAESRPVPPEPKHLGRAAPSPHCTSMADARGMLAGGSWASDPVLDSSQSRCDRIEKPLNRPIRPRLSSRASRML